MAVPDWKQVKAEFLRDQITYEEYKRLCLIDWTETLSPPTTPKLPEWILSLFRPYEERARNATRIEIRRDYAASATIIIAHCLNDKPVAIRVSDEVLADINLDTSFLPSLPTVISPYPILGWRQWRFGKTLTTNKIGMFGYHGQHWETPLMRARCAKGHVAPDEGCKCGIYLTKRWMFSGFEDDPSGIVVATDVIEHERGYRAGLVRCIAISNIHPEAYGWDGIAIMTDTELISYAEALLENPSLIPYPNDLPAP